MTYQPIGNYGLIGDLYTVALVGMDGSIDFMCFPEFDSPSLFAKMLGEEHGGFFRISPVLDDARLKQLYLPDTNILLSRFLSSDGVAEVSDFMPVEEAGDAHNLVRRAKTIRGQITFRMVCEPAFDYGRATHRLEREIERRRRFHAGLRSSCPDPAAVSGAGSDPGRPGHGRVHAG